MLVLQKPRLVALSRKRQSQISTRVEQRKPLPECDPETVWEGLSFCPFAGLEPGTEEIAGNRLVAPSVTPRFEIHAGAISETCGWCGGPTSMSADVLIVGGGFFTRSFTGPRKPK